MCDKNVAATRVRSPNSRGVDALVCVGVGGTGGLTWPIEKEWGLSGYLGLKS